MDTLNQRSFALCQKVIQSAGSLGVEVHELDQANILLDFGVNAPGSAEAGVMLARICGADLINVQNVEMAHAGGKIPAIAVRTDDPLRACMASQYAGWQISVEKYFAMCSGPVRAAYGGEKFFEQYGLGETSPQVVGVLESSRLPSRDLYEWLRSQLPYSVDRLVLCVARTRSLAGRIQIVARSIETACHKLFELGFDLRNMRSGDGIAPLPPQTTDDFAAMGSTNDAVLLASHVRLQVAVDQAEIDRIGPQIPSCSSPHFGRSFAELFDEAGRDFYRMDPALFAPAEITLQNTQTGEVKTFGKSRVDFYLKSLERDDAAARR